MCTVSVIPSNRGVLVGMNRDEHRTRVTGVFSGVRRTGGTAVVGPMEPSGGTWTVANAFGCVFALLNWYAKVVPVPNDPISRGELVSSVAGLARLESMPDRMHRLPLSRLRPFRLVGLSALAREMTEFRWDGDALEIVPHEWRPQCWASSGFDEPAAQAARIHLFQEQAWQADGDSTDLLREFHRGHEPKRGALSVCMHREEAATVSYTEFKIADGFVCASYIPGAPCREETIQRAQLAIQQG